MDAKSGSVRDAEDWFYDSIRQYDQLHMFDLSYPATALSWIGPDRLCVAGEKKNGKGEILELSLPSKLLVPDEGLVKDRDFDLLSGVGCDHPIRQVNTIKDRVIVTSEDDDNLVRVWALGDGSTGSIKPISVLKSPHPEAVPSKIGISPVNHRVVFGSRYDNISLADIETAQVSREIETLDSKHNEILSGIQFMDENVLIACCRDTGFLGVCDLRESPSKINLHEWKHQCMDPNTIWCFDTKPSGEILRCSCEGYVYLSDQREMGAFIKQAKVNQDSRSSKIIEAKLSPVNDSISLADDEGWVRLVSLNEPEASTHNFQEQFIHEGHLVNTEEDSIRISAHIWHPTMQDVILSAATDASLHAWCYNKTYLNT